MNPFQSLREYEEYVYTLKQRFSSIQRSTLVVIRRGKRVAVLEGELTFAQGYRITVQERLSFDTGTVEIEFYGYELWHNVEKIAWYDAQPHPNNPALASTHPHHKHIPPDIKHNRIPAPNMNFAQPNLPVLIGEIENLVAQSLEINEDEVEK
ncbi:MAG: hypothetical protein KKD28_02845 [Chloroflexi bacterium]|nr:hypothetical protein [Chloroflexota bacterium]